MRKFEIGKVYDNRYKVIARTNKTITVCEVHHYGNWNECNGYVKKLKIHDWETREVFFWSDSTIEA